MLSIQNRACAAAAAVVALASLAAAGCGSGSPSTATGSGSASTGSAKSTGSVSPSTPASTSTAGALSAEAKATATGDIPDNQVFLAFTNRRAGYSLLYPEGWTQSGSAADVTFQDKNNLVHVVIDRAAVPSVASVAAQLTALKRSVPSLSFRAPQAARVGPSQAVTARYTTQSAPNPVTGRRVTLMVDRYALASAGRRAVIDLGTPVGVDNVDAYRKMIESFRWR